MRRGWGLLASLLACGFASGCGNSPQWTTTLTLDRVPLSVWAGAAPEVWVSGGPLGSAGSALLLRYDGSAWHAVDAGTTATLWWVFGFTSTDVYAVGERGTIVHWDGAALAAEAAPTTDTLYGVWGASAGDLWAVGGLPDGHGTLLHRDGGGWTEVTGLPNTGAFFKVWGAAADDVFVCGQGGAVLHWDGTVWSAQATGLDPSVSLFTVAGRGGDDVYAVGGPSRAAAIHWDGASWHPVADARLVAAGALAGVAVGADGQVLMVGEGGLKLRGRPGALADDSLAAPEVDLHGAAARGDEWFAVGGNWLAPAPAARHGEVGHYGTAALSSTLR